MKARIKWLDHMSFVAESGSGHTVVMDGSPDHGGRNLASRPMEMVLMGLGGCTSFDVVSMLKKARQDVNHVEVNITAERADAIPAVFTKIHIEFVIDGNDVSDKQIERAVSLSAEKYCSVSKMLEATVEITHSWRRKSDEN
ncbi:MAG: OsmC family protein [Gammaproteobacteria bacterium]|nr:OsmC family protein [Gammaproteobacteria bacterium]